VGAVAVLALLTGCGTEGDEPAIVGVTVADGCLGGPSELDQAVVRAQSQAPVSAVGAASFTAAVMRWAFAGSQPPLDATTAAQILTSPTSSAAQRSLTVAPWSLDFDGGKYVVEMFDGSSAIVSWLAFGRPAGETPDAELRLSGAVHLQAVDGHWRYQDISSERSAENVARIGTRYASGC
jgi:hypothetical protein